MYWDVRRERSDTGPGGYYRRMERSSGPFATSQEAWFEARASNAQLGGAARVAGVNYWVMSDEEIEEARRHGISI